MRRFSMVCAFLFTLSYSGITSALAANDTLKTANFEVAKPAAMAPFVLKTKPLNNTLGVGNVQQWGSTNTWGMCVVLRYSYPNSHLEKMTAQALLKQTEADVRSKGDIQSLKAIQLQGVPGRRYVFSAAQGRAIGQFTFVATLPHPLEYGCIVGNKATLSSPPVQQFLNSFKLSEE